MISKDSKSLETLLISQHNSKGLDWKITNPYLRLHLIETKVDILNLQGIFYSHEQFKQTLLVIYVSFVGVETTKLVFRKEIDKLRC